MRHLSSIVFLLAVILTGCKEVPKNTTTETESNRAVAEPYKLQQTLYYGGDIITMAGPLNRVHMHAYVRARTQKKNTHSTHDTSKHTSKHTAQLNANANTNA